MAPIRDETVDQLRDLVSKLEARVEQLEDKLHKAGGDVSARIHRSASSSIRMILIGPPGAGSVIDLRQPTALTYL
jgi:adenylate kinase